MTQRAHAGVPAAAEVHDPALQHSWLAQLVPLAHFTSQLVPLQLVGPAHAPLPHVSSVCSALLAIEVPQL